MPWSQLWSLAVEEHFYLVFPFLIVRWSAQAQRWRLVLTLVVGALIWRLIEYYWIGIASQHIYVATDSRIDSIVWGCLGGLLVDRTLGHAGRRSLSIMVHPIVFFGGVLLLLMCLGIRAEGFRWTIRFSIEGFALLLIISNLLLDSRWRRVVDFLEWEPIKFVGKVSYSAYLYHLLVYDVIGRFIGAPAMIEVMLKLLATFLVASLSYYFVEGPLKPLRRRLGSRTA